MKHKKYVIFAWPDFEGSGGFNDICDSSDSLKKAKKKVAELRGSTQGMYYGNGHIVNRDTFEIIFEWE